MKTKPRFYCGMLIWKELGILLGPFKTEAEAAAKLPKAKALYLERNPTAERYVYFGVFSDPRLIAPAFDVDAEPMPDTLREALFAFR